MAYDKNDNNNNDDSLPKSKEIIDFDGSLKK